MSNRDCYSTRFTDLSLSDQKLSFYFDLFSEVVSRIFGSLQQQCSSFSDGFPRHGEKCLLRCLIHIPWTQRKPRQLPEATGPAFHQLKGIRKNPSPYYPLYLLVWDKTSFEDCTERAFHGAPDDVNYLYGLLLISLHPTYLPTHSLFLHLLCSTCIESFPPKLLIKPYKLPHDTMSLFWPLPSLENLRSKQECHQVGASLVWLLITGIKEGPGSSNKEPPFYHLREITLFWVTFWINWF